MFRVKENMHVVAPLERVFLLATSIDLVRQTLKMTPVAGKKTGLIVAGDRILWRGIKFGMPVSHETLITGYDAPHFFQDTMGRGWFAHFQHDHQFDAVDGQTLMIDVVRFSMPMGVLGRWFGKKLVAPYVLSLMLQRFEILKRVAEGNDWEKYLVQPGDGPERMRKVAEDLQRIQQA